MKNNAPIRIYRISRFFYTHKMRHLSKAIDWTNRFLFGRWCPGSAKLGKGCSLGYWGGATIIHKDAVLGDNCLIAQNVTIGRNFGDKNVPIIGNDVYIGAGSVVFGEIFIGNNVIIGANSVVNKSVPDNCTVAGNPFRIIRENRQEKYYELDKCKYIKTTDMQNVIDKEGGIYQIRIKSVKFRVAHLGCVLERRAAA